MKRTITSVTKEIKISRQYFYVLLNDGFFPKPLRDSRNNPYYDEEGFRQCKQCKDTGEGINGNTVFFRS